ncbi:MAG TPA: transglutaminase domain-containing protein [Chitinophagaceae bacterium]|nr:transglutaminase domain-containing protein [Chitinophagaceae bacterium]
MKSQVRNLFGFRHYFINRYTVFIINGFLLAATFFLYFEDRYEQKIVSALATTVRSEYPLNTNSDSLLLGSLRLTHYLEERRQLIFGEMVMDDPYTRFLQPVSYDLMTARGACGSYSNVLANILTDLNIPVRFAQMKVGSEYGGHIVVEAKANNNWVVLDPSFNLFFLRPDGKLASFADVSSNWNYYKNQVPANYKPEYAYEAVRYTNWTKIPVLLPAVKSVLNSTIGKAKADEISLRTFFFRKFLWMFYGVLIVYFYSCYRIVRRRFAKNKLRVAVKNQPAREAVILNVHLPQLA